MVNFMAFVMVAPAVLHARLMLCCVTLGRSQSLRLAITRSATLRFLSVQTEDFINASLEGVPTELRLQMSRPHQIDLYYM